MWQSIVNGLSHVLQFLYLTTEAIGIPNYGLAIIFFTILVKLLLFPLTRMQMNSMSSMREIQPKMKEIQEKYKNKPERAQQEMGKLYKETGTNPMAGCLPLLIQMPIIFALFTTLRTFFDPVKHPSFVNLDNANFLWVPNLGMPDPIIFPLLAVVATFGQQYMSTMASAGKVDQTQRTMMIMMPLFVGWIARTLPSGLTIYWVMFSVVSAVEMLVIRRTAKAAKGAGS